MPLTMRREVFITCAVTGSGWHAGPAAPLCRARLNRLPTAPLRPAKAGAAIVHCHVRDPRPARPRAGSTSTAR